MEMTILVVVLSQPALAMIRLWMRKHLHTAKPGAATTDLAAVGVAVL
jgi:hypothetical protein